MASSNTQSRQVQSLVDYILDTKPYSRKLTDIGEEYRFTDYMNVSIAEKLFSTTHMKDTWTYSLLSSGSSSPTPRTQLQRLLDPVFRKYTTNNRPDVSPGAFKAFRDENTDLPLVPYAYDPTTLAGVGLSDAFVQRNGLKNHSEPLLEGHEVFLSHGAYVFDVSQINSASATFDPLFTERRNQGVITKATVATRKVALDLTNPSSCANVLAGELQGLLSAISATGNPAPYAALSALVPPLLIELGPSATDATVANDLPSSYEELINTMKLLTTPELTALGTNYSNPDTFHDRLEAASPSLYFGKWSDLGLRESGKLAYKENKTEQLVVTAMEAPINAPEYQEWKLVVAEDTSKVKVFGSFSGYIGDATIGMEFNHPLVKFDLAYGTIPPVEGFTVSLHPSANITIHPSCTLDAWSLIKVNPLAYSRPQLASVRYGHIQSAAGELNVITVVDQTLITSEFVLEAVTGTTFKVTSPSFPSYSATATVNVPFNDGMLAFTIVQGSVYTFTPGDRFYIQVTNELAHSDDFDLYYGYDMGGFDAWESIYTNVSSADADYLRQLEFGYDSRFVDYDLSAFNLQLAETAVDGQEWRLRALVDTTRPLLRVQRDGTTSNLYDETELDPAATDPQYDQPNDVTDEGIWSSNDPDTTPDLRLWYASSFALERLTSSGWVSVATIPVGGSYSNATYGISFNLVPGNKPFIASRLSSSWYASTTAPSFSTENVDGGDVFYWTITNKPPTAASQGLVSSHTPRLIMHGDTFQKDVPAKWTLTWLSSGIYTIEGVSTANGTAGALLYDPIKSVAMGDGLSYRDDALGIHFTIVPGTAGLAVGDVFTFETYGTSPSYLVHSSVNGWMEPATVGKWYFNGMIGFYIEPPQAALFEGGVLLDEPVERSWTTSVGTVTLNYVRPDSPSFNYTIKGSKGLQWMLYRNGDLVGSGTDTLSDQYVSITLPPASLSTVGKVLTMSMLGDDKSLSIGRDLAIVKTSAARLPAATDFVLLERTRANNLRFAIKPVNAAHQTTLETLEPVSIDPRFVNYSAGLTNVNVTSPEIDILSEWIPILFTKRDTDTSIAEFSDQLTELDIKAASTGQSIGKLANDSAGWGVTWDTTFFDSYMPLNAESVFLTLGSGLNETMSVNFSETLNVLIGGGGLDESFLFNDQININVLEDQTGPLWKIAQQHQETLNVNLDDTFTGFLQGYDTGGYDLEDQVDGYYDIGYPFSTFFDRAKELRAKELTTSLTASEAANLELLESLIQPYLVNTSLDATTFVAFQANIEADAIANRSVYDMFQRVMELLNGYDLSPSETAELSTLTGLLALYVDLSPASAWASQLQAMDVQVEALTIDCNVDVDALTQELNDPLTDPTRRLAITAEINARIATYNTDKASTIHPVKAGIAADTAVLKSELLTNLALLQPESFGLPTSGLAQSVDQTGAEAAGAAIVDAMYVNMNELGVPYDLMGYDVGGYDKVAYVQATFMVSSYVPGVLPGGAWADYMTDLTGYGQYIELSFGANVVSTPTVYVWLEHEPVPIRVTYLERINNRLFRFGIGLLSNFKLAIL